MTISTSVLRLAALLLPLISSCAFAQMSTPEILVTPASPIPQGSMITVIVPARGCMNVTQLGGEAAISSAPTVDIKQATVSAAGTITISVDEVSVACLNPLYRETMFAVPVPIRALTPGLYTINYVTHSLSLDIVVDSNSVSFASPLPGLWAITSEVNGMPGRGFQVERQGDVMVLTFYGYEATGAGRFWLASGFYAYGQFSAPLLTFDGGTSFGGSSQNAQVVGDAGTVNVVFTSASTGMITLPGETPKEISYFRF